MTRAELEDLLDDENYLSGAALIKHAVGGTGIAILLGESLCGVWSSGKTIVFWTNGDHTILPDEFELVHSDLFGVEE